MFIDYKCHFIDLRWSFIENESMFSAGILVGHPIQTGRRNRNLGRSGSVGVGRGWSGQDAYLIPNLQGSSASQMELEYRKNSRIYRQKGTNIDEKAIL
jgi:hypothetical protein